MKPLRVALVTLGLSLTGCAALQQPPTTPEVFEHGVSSGHVELAWTCTQAEPGRLEVRGVARNRGHAEEVRFLELELVGVSAQERTMSQAGTAVPAIVLRTNEASPFRLELRPVGTEVRYDLYYRYQANQGRHVSARDLTGLPLLAQQNHRFLARNACGRRPQ